MARVTRLYVEPDGGEPYIADISMRTVMRWETTFPARSLTDLSSKSSLSARDMYELAYMDAKQRNIPVADKFQDFVKVTEVQSAASKERLDAAQTEEASEETDSSDPTQPVPSTES